MASLAEIRAKLLAQETKSSGTRSAGGGDNAIFPHWNIPEGTVQHYVSFPMRMSLIRSFGKNVK